MGKLQAQYNSIKQMCVLNDLKILRLRYNMHIGLVAFVISKTSVNGGVIYVP